METQEIQTLIQRAQKGDRYAFDQLVNAHERRLGALVHSRMGEHLKRVYDVDDVMQDIFARAFEAVDRFRWQGEDAFMRWLGGIAAHAILKLAHRYEREQKLFIATDPPDSGISPNRGLRREERFERLRNAVAGLSPDHRDVILLARVEGLRIKDIATRMDRSPAATKQLLSRALRALRKSFGDTESLHLPPRSLKNEGANHDAP